MRRRPLALFALPLFLTTVASTAAADWVVGVDADYVHAFPKEDEEVAQITIDESGIDPGEGENGGGFHGRLGYQLDAMLLYLRPEIGGSPIFFDGHTDWRAYGGARFGLLTGLSPGVYAHAGYGWYGKNQEFKGFTYDAGLLLDVTILPFFNLGLHGGWVGNPDPAQNWINGGFHGEFQF